MSCKHTHAINQIVILKEAAEVKREVEEAIIEAGKEVKEEMGVEVKREVKEEVDVEIKREIKEDVDVEVKREVKEEIIGVKEEPEDDVEDCVLEVRFGISYFSDFSILLTDLI